MQTAKEELQSANEELTTVNDELHSGNRDLNLANSDLVNLLNTVEIPIVFVDAQRRIRRFTPQAHSVFNVLTTDIGRPIDDIKPKVEVADLDEQIAWSIANVTVRESQVRDQFGRWYRMQIRPYQTSEGKVTGAILSLVDIDVLKRHAEQAEWSRDYAVSVVDAVGVPLVVLDDKALVISANDAFYESFGGEQAHAKGRSFFALGNGEWDLPLLRAKLSNLFARRAKLQTLEIEAPFPRVGLRIMSFSARAVRFRDAKPMVLLAIEDVSQRKQLLAEAQEARASAEQANLSKDAFLATLSHELRTPLGTILMNAQLLRRADLDATVIQRAAAAIERAARSQSRMIEDLLDVSRIVTGKLSLDLHGLNLKELVASALESVTLQAASKNLRLEARLGEEPFSVSGDSLRLQQVVSNLLTNAIKFTPGGGAVTVALAVEGKDAVLRVSDTGSGINPSFLPFVFERFSQQENSGAQRSTGLGLGLSIVRDIVAMHGGQVRAASDGIGKGASFAVSLPLLRGAAPEEALQSGGQNGVPKAALDALE